jgi:hypothetical protein
MDHRNATLANAKQAPRSSYAVTALTAAVALSLVLVRPAVSGSPSQAATAHSQPRAPLLQPSSLAITSLASVNSDGMQAHFASYDSSISGDGRYIAFQSGANNLVPGDTNGDPDIFVHDRIGGATTRVSVNSSGGQVNGNSRLPCISGDGRFVAFDSDARLVHGDTNGLFDVFVHDRLTGETVRASVSSNGDQGNGDSIIGRVSDDGRMVVFHSNATNLVPGDTNGDYDVFVHDMLTGVTVLADVDSSGKQGNSWAEFATISADGRFVAFMSGSTNLVPGDTNNNPDVFVHDLLTGATERVDVSSSGTQAGSGTFGTISADGRFVAFTSSASNLVPGDTNGHSDVFLHDRQTGLTTRVSVDSNGGQSNGDSGIGLIPFNAISGDGRFVAFRSEATNLVPGDTNHADDIFVHDLQTGITKRVSVDSFGRQAQGGSEFPSISRDGRLVSFSSLAKNLVEHDTNSNQDIFVNDSVELSFHGVPSSPNLVNFTLSNVAGEATNMVLVLLSCSGTAGFPLADGRTVPLTFDPCTIAGLQLMPVLSATIDANGVASTPLVAFPPAPAGQVVHAAGITLDANARAVISITAPIGFITQ